VWSSVMGLMWSTSVAGCGQRCPLCIQVHWCPSLRSTAALIAGQLAGSLARRWLLAHLPGIKAPTQRGPAPFCNAASCFVDMLGVTRNFFDDVMDARWARRERRGDPRVLIIVLAILAIIALITLI